VLALLSDASVVSSSDIPPQLATLNSRLLVLHEESGQSQQLMLCEPADADPAAGRISVLSPVGAVLLGRSAGARLAWTSPTGVLRHLRLQSVLSQPAAAGERPR
jgi:regulator of nucleoside diphosphate kinase